MARKIMYIINPVSGNKKAAELIPKIKEAMEIAHLNFDFKISSREGSIEAIAAKAVSDGFNEIIAVGGDGTIMEVLNGIHGRNVVMGIIPSGTGNDFIRATHIPKSVDEAIECIAEGYYEAIDVGYVNEKLFLNVVSMGIDGKIIKDFEKIKKWIKGPTAYLLSTLKTIASFNPIKIKMWVNGEQKVREIALIAVGNGQYFGGGMKITPLAEIDDGLLDVCVVNSMARHRLMKFFPKVFDGAHICVDEVEYFKCTKIELESDTGETYVNSDGNLIDMGKATISLAKQRQNLLMCKPKTTS